MRISIIIPSYNGEELLKRNLPKVIKECQACLPARQVSSIKCQEIIIVDDGSSDGSVKSIKYQVSSIKYTKPKIKIKLIENKKNLGFASTVNRGVKEAEGEIVILLNTDVYPEENFIQPLLTHFKDPEVFAVGMMDKSLEGNKIVRRGRGIGWWERGFLVHKRGEIDRTDTFWVSGGSGAFRRSVWLKLGGFDEIYNPFYWEDIDLSYRAVKQGYKIIFEPKSIVVHEHLKGTVKKQYSNSYIKTISFRNQFIFVWKNANFKQFTAHVLWLPYHLILNLSHKRKEFFQGLWLALKRVLQMKLRICTGQIYGARNL